MTLDIIPAALPLLLDLMIKTWPPGDYPKSVDLALEPLPQGWVDVLPSATAILDAFDIAQVNFCDPSAELKGWMRIRSQYANRATRIIATSGDLSRPYDVVGRVDVSAEGTNYWVFNYWRFGSLGTFDLRHYEYKEDPAAMNEMLKFRAFEKFGDTFDAILNVHYESMPHNSVSAGGVAVRFTGSEASAHQGNEERLKEIRNLLDKGLITNEQYEQKRADILKGL